MARVLEGPSPLGRELAAWEQRLADGCRRLREIGQGSRMIPPLFLWLVDSCAEDMPGGFAHAARIYGARAAARSEMLLYAALPVSILALAFLIVGQMLPLIRFLKYNMQALYG
jgi:hypothetical protein